MKSTSKDLNKKGIIAAQDYCEMICVEIVRQSFLVLKNSVKSQICHQNRRYSRIIGILKKKVNFKVNLGKQRLKIFCYIVTAEKES